MLAGPGIEVVEAADEQAAFAAAAQSEPDVAVLDWGFPGGGLTLARELAGSHGLAERIVLLSPLTDPRDQRSALEAGVARYLVKPIRREQLIEAIHEVALAHSNGRF
jgi:DNA-binding NarL/FixJ family response regulator